MRKIILFVVLSFILLMVCCNRVTEKDILGVYAEKHQFYKDIIWILPNGEFRQKAYNRDGSLFYDAKSHWNLEDGMIIVDSLFWFPEGCDNDDIVYDAKNVGSGFFKISRKNGIYAVYVPYWIELDKGIYFYKVEDGYFWLFARLGENKKKVKSASRWILTFSYYPIYTTYSFTLV